MTLLQDEMLQEGRNEISWTSDRSGVHIASSMYGKLTTLGHNMLQRGVSDRSSDQ